MRHFDGSYAARVALLLFLAVLGFAASAQALPNIGQELEWYSDNTYSVQVGYYYYDCGCCPTHWGHSTDYMVIATSPYGCGSQCGQYSYGPCGGISQVNCFTCQL
jgi:hypothetical protein